MNTTLDRSAINRALSKAIAYSQCGKSAEADAWAVKLIQLLECEGILKDRTLERIAFDSQVISKS